MGAAPEAPRTIAGLSLRALLLQDFDGSRRLNSRLNGGQPGWNKDEPAVFEAACELVACRFFVPGYDAGEVSAYVSGLLARVPESRMRAGQHEVEAVVRAALGDTDVVLDGIRPAVLLNIQQIVIADLAYSMDLAEAAIDHMLSQAERVAVERGWNPPLAEPPVK